MKNIRQILKNRINRILVCVLIAAVSLQSTGCLLSNMDVNLKTASKIGSGVEVDTVVDESPDLPQGDHDYTRYDISGNNAFYILPGLENDPADMLEFKVLDYTADGRFVYYYITPAWISAEEVESYKTKENKSSGTVPRSGITEPKRDGYSKVDAEILMTYNPDTGEYRVLAANAYVLSWNPAKETRPDMYRSSIGGVPVEDSPVRSLVFMEKRGYACAVPEMDQYFIMNSFGQGTVYDLDGNVVLSLSYVNDIMNWKNQMNSVWNDVKDDRESSDDEEGEEDEDDMEDWEKEATQSDSSEKKSDDYDAVKLVIQDVAMNSAYYTYISCTSYTTDSPTEKDAWSLGATIVAYRINMDGSEGSPSFVATNTTVSEQLKFWKSIEGRAYESKFAMALDPAYSFDSIKEMGVTSDGTSIKDSFTPFFFSGSTPKTDGQSDEEEEEFVEEDDVRSVIIGTKDFREMTITGFDKRDIDVVAQSYPVGPIDRGWLEWYMKEFDRERQADSSSSFWKFFNYIGLSTSAYDKLTSYWKNLASISGKRAFRAIHAILIDRAMQEGFSKGGTLDSLINILGERSLMPLVGNWVRERKRNYLPLEDERITPESFHVLRLVEDETGTPTPQVTSVDITPRKRTRLHYLIPYGTDDFNNHSSMEADHAHVEPVDYMEGAERTIWYHSEEDAAALRTAYGEQHPELAEYLTIIYNAAKKAKPNGSHRALAISSLTEALKNAAVYTKKEKKEKTRQNSKKESENDSEEGSENDSEEGSENNSEEGSENDSEEGSGEDSEDSSGSDSEENSDEEDEVIDILEQIRNSAVSFLEKIESARKYAIQKNSEGALSDEDLESLLEDLDAAEEMYHELDEEDSQELENLLISAGIVSEIEKESQEDSGRTIADYLGYFPEEDRDYVLAVCSDYAREHSVIEAGTIPVSYTIKFPEGSGAVIGKQTSLSAAAGTLTGVSRGVLIATDMSYFESILSSIFSSFQVDSLHTRTYGYHQGGRYFLADSETPGSPNEMADLTWKDPNKKKGELNRLAIRTSLGVRFFEWNEERSLYEPIVFSSITDKVKESFSTTDKDGKEYHYSDRALQGFIPYENLLSSSGYTTDTESRGQNATEEFLEERKAGSEEEGESYTGNGLIDEETIVETQNKRYTGSVTSAESFSMIDTNRAFLCALNGGTRILNLKSGEVAPDETQGTYFRLFQRGRTRNFKLVGFDTSEYTYVDKDIALAKVYDRTYQPEDLDKSAISSFELLLAQMARDYLYREYRTALDENLEVYRVEIPGYEKSEDESEKNLFSPDSSSAAYLKELFELEELYEIDTRPDEITEYLLYLRTQAASLKPAITSLYLLAGATNLATSGKREEAYWKNLDSRATLLATRTDLEDMLVEIRMHPDAASSLPADQVEKYDGYRDVLDYSAEQGAITFDKTDYVDTVSANDPAAQELASENDLKAEYRSDVLNDIRMDYEQLHPDGNFTETLENLLNRVNPDNMILEKEGLIDEFVDFINHGSSVVSEEPYEAMRQRVHEALPNISAVWEMERMIISEKVQQPKFETWTTAFEDYMNEAVIMSNEEAAKMLRQTGFYKAIIGDLKNDQTVKETLDHAHQTWDDYIKNIIRNAGSGVVRNDRGDMEESRYLDQILEYQNLEYLEEDVVQEETGTVGD